MKLSMSITNGPSPTPAPGLPRPPERDIKDTVELADMPEGERAQERPHRRGRHDPVPEDQPGRACPQRVHLIDAVSPAEHPVDQAHHLAAGQRCARGKRVKAHRLVDRLLDREPLAAKCDWDPHPTPPATAPHFRLDPCQPGGRGPRPRLLRDR
jgi:hypothetical protein